MKRTFLLAGLVLSLFASLSASAQININISRGIPVAQQTWYQSDNDYYYMPEQGVYYNARRGGYVYPEGSNWMYASNLPARYGNCSYNNVRAYRINGRAPFMRNEYYRNQYSQAYREGYRDAMRDDRRNNGRRNGWYRNGKYAWR